MSKNIGSRLLDPQLELAWHILFDIAHGFWVNWFIGFIPWSNLHNPSDHGHGVFHGHGPLGVGIQRDGFSMFFLWKIPTFRPHSLQNQKKNIPIFFAGWKKRVPPWLRKLPNRNHFRGVLNGNAVMIAKPSHVYLGESHSAAWGDSSTHLYMEWWHDHKPYTDTP